MNTNSMIQHMIGKAIEDIDNQFNRRIERGSYAIAFHGVGDLRLLAELELKLLTQQERLTVKQFSRIEKLVSRINYKVKYA